MAIAVEPHVMAPRLQHPHPVHPYANGPGGPPEAEQVLGGPDAWVAS